MGIAQIIFASPDARCCLPDRIEWTDKSPFKTLSTSSSGGATQRFCRYLPFLVIYNLSQHTSTHFQPVGALLSRSLLECLLTRGGGKLHDRLLPMCGLDIEVHTHIGVTLSLWKRTHNGANNLRIQPISPY